MPGDVGPRLLQLVDQGFSDASAEQLAGLIGLASGAPTALIHLRIGADLRLAGAANPPPGWQRLKSAPASGTLAGWIVTHGHPLIIVDLLTDPRVPPDAPARAVGIRSYAGFPIRDADSEIVGTCAVMDYQPREWDVAALSGVAAGAATCTAIAAEHRVRAQADRQRRFLDALLESLQAGVLAVDSDGRVMFTNTAMRALCATLPTPEDLAAWADGYGSLSDWFGGDTPAVAVPLLHALTGEDVGESDLMVDDAHGQPHHFLIDAEPIAGSDQERLGAVLVARDVTGQRRAERFARAEAAVSAALADAPTIDQATTALLDALCSTLGWTYGEFWLVEQDPERLVPAACHSAGRSDVTPLPTDPLSKGEGLAGAAWAAGDAVWRRAEHDTTLDDVRMARVVGLRTGVAAPIPLSGRTQAVLCLFSDRLLPAAADFVERSATLSTHIGQYLHRRRAEEAELALARAKDEYLALIGHEMRTPLTSISSYTELALDDSDPDPATTRQLLTVIDRNATRLRRIIDELIDMAALDANEGVHLDHIVDLAAIANAATAAISGRAITAGLHLSTELASGCTVLGDGERLRQVLDHLLENAVLHSPHGGSLTVVLTRDADTATLTVRDTGTGIPAAEQDRVFDRFYRSAYTREQQIPGAGLGLPISRAIIEIHGGTLTLTASDLPPTELVIRLPLTQNVD